jgi:serine/threonine protein kinase/WD40 repeat protein
MMAAGLDPEAETLRTGSGPEPAAAPDLFVFGQWVGHYRILQQIGEGGCGMVYLAEQEEPLRRQVALKIIKPGMDTRQVIARFEVERRALALMDHPNIAKVHDAGTTPDGRPYFVMELVRGVPLTRYCDEQRLSTEARLELFVPVCRAIQHAHQKGVIHRDLKPSNVLVTVQDGMSVPKVIDFGIAKATGSERLTEQTLVTAVNQFMGTPAYMSPEQTRLGITDIDTRSDIYSLGVLLYELLTGRTPFDSRELLEAGLEEMCRVIREQEPPRPSARLGTMAAAERTLLARQRHADPPRLLHEVRGELDWVVMKAMDKERARRYQTAEALALDLRRHLDNQPVTAAAPSAGYLFGKFVRRHRAGLAAATTVFLLLVCGAVVSLWQAAVARQNARDAREQTARLYDERGWQLQQQGDGLGAFSSFAEALALARPASDRETAERMRLGFLAQTLPELQRGFVLPRRPQDLVYTMTRESLFNMNSGSIRDANTRRGIFLPQEPLHGIPLLLSPDARWLLRRDTGEVWNLEDGRLAIRLASNQGWARRAWFSATGEHLLLAARRFPPAGVPSQTQHAVLTDLAVFRTSDWALAGTLTITGAVFDCAFTADGKQFVAAVTALETDGSGLLSWKGQPGQTWLVEAATCRLLGEPRNQTGGVTAVAVSADGSRVASGSWLGCEVFDARSGEPLVQGIAGPRTHIALSPDGTHVVFDAYRGADVWDVVARRRIGSFPIGLSPSCLSPDGKLVANSSSNSSVELRDLDSFTLLHALAHPAGVTALQFSSDGSKLLTTCADSGVRLWDVATGRQVGPTLIQEGTLLAVLSPDARRLVTVAREEAVRVWSLPGSTAGGFALASAAKAKVAAFSPGSEVLVTGGSDGHARAWNSQSGEELGVSSGQDGPIVRVALRLDTNLATTVTSEHTVQAWQLPALQPLGQPLTLTNWHWASDKEPCLSPDGQFLAEIHVVGPPPSQGRENLELWEIAPRKLLSTLKTDSQIYRPRFSPDGRLLAVPLRGLNSRVYEIPSLKQRPLNNPEDLWLTKCISTDGSEFAAIDPNGRTVLVGFIGTQERELRASLKLHFSANVNHVAFSPDSRLLVSCSDDFSARLWDARSLQAVGVPFRHHGPVVQAAWSSDGRLLATASKDKTARVWQAATGEPITPPLPLDAPVESVTFSPNGQHLVAIGEDGLAGVWHLPVDRRLVAQLRELYNVP